ncbi:MAG: response regulator [Desulfobacterales bacterium]|nr:response regulator [Desulfobacterales bacterium]
MVTNKNGLSLMLIDNDKHVRESLSVFFGVSHSDFLSFKTGEEGLNALRYQKVDVVISDYFLPDMDGLAFLIEAAGLQPEVIRILMATITSENLERQILASGIDRFIEKPLTVATLDTVINELRPE